MLRVWIFAVFRAIEHAGFIIAVCFMTQTVNLSAQYNHILAIPAEDGFAKTISCIKSDFTCD